MKTAILALLLVGCVNHYEMPKTVAYVGAIETKPFTEFQERSYPCGTNGMCFNKTVKFTVTNPNTLAVRTDIRCNNFTFTNFILPPQSTTSFPATAGTLECHLANRKTLID